MQNMQIQQFGNQIRLLIPDMANCRVTLPYFIGMAIGNLLAVKQGQELSPMTAFADAHAGNVARAVSYINEDLIIDVSATIEAARTQYLLRHRIVNGACPDYSANPEFDIMAIAMGISTIWPVEVYNAMKAIGISASRVFQQANLLVVKLKEDGQINL